MKKIAVIGTSHIGAVNKAWETERITNKQFSLDFYGNGGHSIKLASVENGILKGIQYSSTKVNNINLKEYDLFLIYCDLFEPNFIYLRKNSAKLNLFSSQVINEAIKDEINTLNSMRLFNEIRETISCPVYIASKPICPSAYSLSKEAFIETIDTIKKIIYPAIYLDPPLNLLNKNFIGNEDYFKDSLLITGKKHYDKHLYHDDSHMNEKGGREFLLHFLNKISS